MKLERIGHVALWVSDEDRSRAFYRDVLGLAISEQDPEHGGTFMTLGESFHTFDVLQTPDPANAPKPVIGQVGLWHIAFAVAHYADLKTAYATLLEQNVPISQWGRSDKDEPLQVTRPGEPLPAWLDEDWLARFAPLPTAPSSVR